MKKVRDFRTATAISVPVYTPGEQPAEPGWIKLNTNESPFEPSPLVNEVLKKFSQDSDRLRKYPHPYGEPLRSMIARYWSQNVNHVLVTNGSDEALTLICRAFLEKGRKAAFPSVTYSLYKSLVLASGAEYVTVPVISKKEVPFCIDLPGLEKVEADVIFLANPNALTGELTDITNLKNIIGSSDKLWIIDEAYNDFAEQGNASFMPFLHDCQNVIVLRTFSKTHALAGLRIGYAVTANSDLMQGMLAFKDSYNEDLLAVEAGAAAFSDHNYFHKTISYIRDTRKELAENLRALGFTCLPTDANYILCRPPAGKSARKIYEALKEKKILVRHYPDSEIEDYLRISVGNRQEMQKLHSSLVEILQ